MRIKKEYKKLYNKRIIIENYHAWLKDYIKIKTLKERNIKNYTSMVHFAVAIMIHRKINLLHDQLYE